MQNFKIRWGITQNWQLIHPILGIIASIASGFLIAKRITTLFYVNGGLIETVFLFLLTIIATYAIIRVSLWLFKKLENRWKVQFRWEYIAIFLCFATTGSSAGRLSNPIMDFIGLSKDLTSSWLYWPVRILLIFPIYQVLLVIFGWIFGQYTFFKAFAQKMMSRIGLGFLANKL